jgi:pimeloyl-ACP methyl ester carboxylesterase
MLNLSNFPSLTSLTLSHLWNRDYEVEHHRFHVNTEDGVRIAGIHLNRRDSETLTLYVHGFMSNKNHRAVPGFVQALSNLFDVMAIDLRGHGESEGGCTMGAREVLDIEATVQYARSLGYRRVITIGSSMGGASVIRHAAIYGTQDGVVTIGAFADPQEIGPPATDYGLQLLYTTGAIGDWLSYLVRGTRLDALHAHESPLELVGNIAPIPLLLIHGEWDYTVHPTAAQRLYDAANEPKELVIAPRTGHDLPLLTQATANRIREWMRRHDLEVRDAGYEMREAG